MTFNSLLEGKLQEVLDREIAKNNAAGVNLLLLKDGKELAYVQSGYADVDSKKAFERDTIMRIFSMTKPVTAVAVLILVERGLISLSESIAKYIPEFADLRIWKDENTYEKVTRALTIKDLMFMSSGLPYGNAMETETEKRVQHIIDDIIDKLGTDEEQSTVDIAGRLAGAGVMFVPGDKWMYGTSADILGALVEVVSGMSYGEFLKKELFVPLEMNDTGFWVPEEKRSRLASAYERREGELYLFETNNLGIKYTMDRAPKFESGGAGLVSTIDDYSHFAMMLMNGGIYKGKRILSEGTVKFATHGKLMPWQQQVFNHDWDNHAGYSYGCLMHHMVEPGMAYYMTWMDEYGWDGWLGTYFINSPENGVTLLMGMQISNPEGNLIFEKVRNTIGQYL